MAECQLPVKPTLPLKSRQTSAYVATAGYTVYTAYSDRDGQFALRAVSLEIKLD